VTRRLAATAAVVCLSMLLLQMWLITHRNLDIDELEHAHAAWSFAHGLMPYRDFFEHHTPWIYFAAAPTLASARVATNTDAALGWFVDARLVMLAITVAVMALVYVHARLGGDTWSGLIAVTLLVTSAQFMDRILDFRPDVPALGCGMASLLLARIGWRSESRRVPLLAWLASGAMLGAAVMFTQKCLFVLPGFGLALLIDVARASSHQRIVRLWRVVVFGVGVVAPIALTVAWFARHDALIPFLHYNLAENLRLNQQRFSPLPRALAHVLHSPALAIPGLLGLIGETRMVWRRPDDRVLLVATAFSWLAGVVIQGRVYEQYWIQFLPLFAVFGSWWLQQHIDQLPSVGSTGALRLRMLTLAAVIVSVIALVMFVPDPTATRGAIQVAGFGASAALTGVAVWVWTRGRRTAAGMFLLVAMAALAVGNVARDFDGMDQQVADLRYVIEHTAPTDATFAASTGAGVFRPHVWYYFFNSGSFATDAELAEISDAIVGGRVRPRIVMLAPLEMPIPPAIWTYVQSHYRRVSPTLYDRDVTEGKTSTAARD